MAKENTAPRENVTQLSIPIDKGVAMPARTRKASRAQLYPIDKLEVGDSFHVASDPQNPKDNPVSRLSSTISSAKIRFSPILKDANGQNIMETVEHREYERGANGKGYAKDANGGRIVKRVYTSVQPKRGEPTRVFSVVAAAADDERGPGARCFRLR